MQLRWKGVDEDFVMKTLIRYRRERVVQGAPDREECRKIAMFVSIKDLFSSENRNFVSQTIYNFSQMFGQSAIETKTLKAFVKARLKKEKDPSLLLSRFKPSKARVSSPTT